MPNRGGKAGRSAGCLSSRMLVLGVCASVGGFAGAIRGVASGASVFQVLAALGIGALGLTLAIAYVVDFGRR